MHHSIRVGEGITFLLASIFLSNIIASKLLQVKLITIEQADGILYSLNTVQEYKGNEVEYVTANDLRAAHLYNIVFTRVKRNLAIAGLKSQIDVKMTFSSSYSKSN